MTPLVLTQTPVICLTLLSIGCSASKSDTSTAPADQSSPQCLEQSEQSTLWHRLGSPLDGSLSNQVAPSLLVSEDTLWLYYSQRTGLQDSIMLIKSSDGETWSAPTSIQDLDNFSDIMHLNVRSTDEGFSAMIGGGRIGSAESIDGLSWSILGEQIIPTSGFDSLGQTYPAQGPDGDRVWFSGFSGQTYAIGLASKGSEGWSNRGAVLERNNDGRYDNTAVGQSSVLEVDGSLRIWFGGYDTSQTDPGPWRILTASSDDGLSWSDRQLALDLTDTGEEAWSVREPSLALWRGQLWMAYIGMGDDGAYRLRTAVCE